jgi:cysteine desulfurase
MLTMLKERVEDLIVNSPENSIPSILSVSFLGVSAETMLMNLDMQGIAASSGSACTAGALQPSHVLTAMGLHAEVVKSVIRFSFSEDNSLAEIETAARVTAELANKLRRTRK